MISPLPLIPLPFWLRITITATLIVITFLVVPTNFNTAVTSDGRLVFPARPISQFVEGLTPAPFHKQPPSPI